MSKYKRKQGRWRTVGRLLGIGPLLALAACYEPFEASEEPWLPENYKMEEPPGAPKGRIHTPLPYGRYEQHGRMPFGPPADPVWLPFDDPFLMYDNDEHNREGVQ